MPSPFREYHILNILKEYEAQPWTLDLFLRNYFRENKSLGPKDRSEVAQTVYDMIRWKGLLDFLSSPAPTWEKKLKHFSAWNLPALLKNEEIPIHVRLSFPKILFDLFVKDYGYEKACELCLISNSQAPTTLRANLLKTTREALLRDWDALYSVAPCPLSETGIVFNKRVNFFEMETFKQGLFEIQDEGSQLLAGLVKVKPGDLVMDYCAGAGGKSLAFAPHMQNKGQIFLHDVRKHVLLDCKKRLKRAGIQNAQIIHSDDAKLKKLKKKMDWVLVDAPCSGTGTIRRNPDMKWKFDQDLVERLTGQQRMIFERGLSFLKPGGHIVYATCSLLKEENGDQVQHFMKTYELELASEVFESFPVMGGMDGFYGAVLRKKKLINE